MASMSLNTPYLLLSGVVLVAIVAVFTVFQPMVGEIITARQSIATAAQTLVEKESFLSTLDQKRSQLQANAQHEHRLNVVLPVDESIEDVLRIIHTAGQSSGGTVTGVRNTSESTISRINNLRSRGQGTTLPGAVTPLSFQTEFAGSYQQLRVFLEQIKLSPRLMDVMSLSVTRNPQQSDALTAQLEIWFYQYQGTGLSAVNP